MSTIQKSYLTSSKLTSANTWSSLQFSKNLKLAGFNDAQAELLSEEMNLLQHTHETVIKGINKAELYQVFATKSELYQVRDELKSDLHQAEEKIVNKLCVRLGGLILACCSVCVGLIGFLSK